MCECTGYVGSAENRCEGCAAWRQKYRVEIGRPCTENISKTARRAGAAMCAYCWEARAGQYSPRSQASAHSGRSTPVQNPQLNAPPPPPQLHDICARMEAMLGRMEGVLGLLVSQSQRAALAPPASPPGIAAQPMQVDMGAPRSSLGGPGPLVVQAQPAVVDESQHQRLQRSSGPDSRSDWPSGHWRPKMASGYC